MWFISIDINPVSIRFSVRFSIKSYENILEFLMEHALMYCTKL